MHDVLLVGLNQKSALTVKMTVLDKLSWYQQFILDEQRANPKTSVGAMANHIVKYYVEVSAPSFLLRVSIDG